MVVVNCGRAGIGDNRINWCWVGDKRRNQLHPPPVWPNTEGLYLRWSQNPV